jgi:predicted phage terminase large subunit-like protein
MSEALQNHDIKRLEVIGFRGCAKSTMASLALVLWAALEHPDKYPFIIMLADTRNQASINSSTVQHELRDNELILKDYGHLKYRRIDDPRPEPTLESDEDWQVMKCVLDNGVRILSRSRGQNIRGLRHRQHRPSLIVADDVEDLDWVRTQENCDKSDRWMRGNVLPSIDEHNGRMVIIGNGLHTDSLMARLKNTGLFHVLESPLFREGDRTESRALYMESQISDPRGYQPQARRARRYRLRREMLMQVVPEEGQDVFPEDMKYYDDPPFDDGNHLAHGVDLAISTKESADYTAIVSGEVTWPGGNIEIYILPNPIIRRMTFTETMDTLDNARKSAMSSEFFVEAIAYQQAVIEEMERRAFSMQAMHPIKDKRARLRVAARYIKMGVVKFPRHGCEQLLTQLLGFGGEKHDDACDATCLSHSWARRGGDFAEGYTLYLILYAQNSHHAFFVLSSVG